MEWCVCERVCVQYMRFASSVSQYDMKTRLRVFVYDFISFHFVLIYLISLSSLNYDHMTILITILPWIIAALLINSIWVIRCIHFFVLSVCVLVHQKGHGKFVYASSPPCICSHSLWNSFRINFACLQQIQMNSIYGPFQFAVYFAFISHLIASFVCLFNAVGWEKKKLNVDWYGFV